MNCILGADQIQPANFVSVATRTLLAAGYSVSNCQRHPGYAEISCEITSRIGADIRYLIAFTDQEQFTPAQREEIRREAESDRRVPAFIARCVGDDVSWKDFLDALGGAVPSWHALAAEYPDLLRTTARNELPARLSGEAWRLFEELTADGLEFVFGHRVRRLGGRKRGLTVSDMIAQIPDGALEVVDAKAAGSVFDADWSSLRPLIEYVRRQEESQRGQNEVFGAILVSPGFKQDGAASLESSRRFLAETRVPLAFLDVETLISIVARLQHEPHLRNAIRWRSLLAGGIIDFGVFSREADQARDERYAREEG